MTQGQNCFDQAGNTRCRFQMTEVTLHRTEGAGHVTATVGRRKGIELDRVAEGGSGSVGLDEVHRCGGDVCRTQCAGDHLTLRGSVGRGEPVGAAVLIER